MIRRLKYKCNIRAVNDVPKQQREQRTKHFALAVHAVPAPFELVELQGEVLMSVLAHVTLAAVVPRRHTEPRYSLRMQTCDLTLHRGVLSPARALSAAA